MLGEIVSMGHLPAKWNPRRDSQGFWYSALRRHSSCPLFEWTPEPGFTSSLQIHSKGIWKVCLFTTGDDCTLTRDGETEGWATLSPVFFLHQKKCSRLFLHAIRTKILLLLSTWVFILYVEFNKIRRWFLFVFVCFVKTRIHNWETNVLLSFNNID